MLSSFFEVRTDLLASLAGLSAAPLSLVLVVGRPCFWMSILFFPALCPFLGLGVVPVVGLLTVHASCLFAMIFLFASPYFPAQV